MKNYIIKQTTIIQQVVFIMVFTIFFSSCGPSEKELLQSKVDSLQNVLKTTQEMERIISEVTVLIDSIDKSRQVLKIKTIEDSKHKNYVELMKDLNKYVRDTEKKIQRIEKQLKKSKSSNKLFVATIERLKLDIELRNTEIFGLKETIEKFRIDNENLIKLNQEQVVSILDQQIQIETKKQEVISLEQKIDEVITNSRVTEANNYFTHAQAVEETAKKTRLAPRKKKDTMNKSLDLYKKALLLGNVKAKSKIEELEQAIN